MLGFDRSFCSRLVQRISPLWRGGSPQESEIADAILDQQPQVPRHQAYGIVHRQSRHGPVPPRTSPRLYTNLPLTRPRRGSQIRGDFDEVAFRVVREGDDVIVCASSGIVA